VTEPVRRLRVVEPPATPRNIDREMGHGQSSSWWSMLEDEPTPELRWPESIAVFDRMRRQDPQVQSVLRAVTLPVRQTRWRLNPGDARPEVVQHVSANLGLPIVGAAEGDQPKLPRVRDRFSWKEHLSWALLHLVFGHMFFEQVYRPDEASGLYHLRKLAPRWPKTIQEIRTAADGGLEAIVQKPIQGGRLAGGSIGGVSRGTPAPVVLEVNRLVAYVNEREGGNWIGTSLLRAAYKDWLLKDQALRGWRETGDRNGMGVPVYTGAENETDLTGGETIARNHRSGASSGAAIPFGAKLLLQGVQGALPNLEAEVRYHDESIARAVLAHFLNLGQASGTGSYALGSGFIDFFVMSLQSLAQDIADIATAHIVEDLVDVNWGPAEPAPFVQFDPIGQNPSLVVAAVKALIESGAIFPDPALDAFVRTLTGLPPKAPLPNPTTPAGAAEPPPGTDV
jgi:hypothetical protein